MSNSGDICTDSNEQQLIAKAKSGDSIALERLLLMYYDQLTQHIKIKLPASIQQAVDADDILQQTFLQVFRDIRNFKSHSSLSFFNWIKTIAENRLLDTIKGFKRKKRGGDCRRVREVKDSQTSSIKDLAEMLSADIRSPSRSFARYEAIQAVQIRLAYLPDDQREAIRLRFLEGKSLEEIAIEMGRTKGAIRALLYRAKQELHKAMGRSSQWLSKK